ncbi:MAG: glycosyltransferase family protein [Limisphaerales bacterium]
MANIFFGVSGEGRGHATRVRAQVEALRAAHDITVFASGEAFSFLAPLYDQTDVRVRRIAGLRFHYSPNRRLDFTATALRAMDFVRRLPEECEALSREFLEHRPDLVVSDFEPVLPRAARRHGVPFLSVDHQHFLTTYDLSSLPRRLRLRAFFMAAIVRAYFQGQRETVVSSFYFPPLRRSCVATTQVGVMLRGEIRAARPSHGRYLVAYLRRFAGRGFLEALNAIGREVVVYGLGERPTVGRLRFRAVDEERFLEDLAGCDALLSTAGNQVVGEALYLRKPVFAMPEARNFEQYINAHFLKRTGAGDWLDLERVTENALRDFLDRVDDYRRGIRAGRLDGLPATLQVMERHLPAPGAVPGREWKSSRVDRVEQADRVAL